MRREGSYTSGEIFNGAIKDNSIVVSRSSDPNGASIMVEGTPDTGPFARARRAGIACRDKATAPASKDWSMPTWANLANLIQGNSADSRGGGGIHVQQVNGTEAGTFASQLPLRAM